MPSAVAARTTPLNSVMELNGVAEYVDADLVVVLMTRAVMVGAVRTLTNEPEIWKIGSEKAPVPMLPWYPAPLTSNIGSVIVPVPMRPATPVLDTVNFGRVTTPALT